MNRRSDSSCGKGDLLTWMAGAAATYAAVAAVVRSRRAFDFRGKLVLITGGTRGLGLALVRRFAAAGATVAVCARDSSELAKVVRELTEAGQDNVLAFTADVRLPDECEKLVADVTAAAGRPVDVLVNNAGIIQVGPLECMTRSDFDDAMATHFSGPLNLIWSVLPAMRGRRSGRIVNVASIGGKLPVPHLVPYSASKFALVGLSEALRTELTRDNVYVTTVIPGMMRTGSPPHALFKGNAAAEYEWFATGDTLPLLSIGADRMAAAVVRACKYGDAELTKPLAASVPAKLFGLMPGVGQEVAALVNRLLPSAAGGTRENVPGRMVETSPPEIVRRAVEATGKRYNERGDW